MNKTELWHLIEKERLQLADILTTLKPTDWDQVSLVPEWRIRDVVAHIILESNYNARSYLPGLIRARFSINRYMHQAACQLGQQTPNELINRLRQTAFRHISPPGIQPFEVAIDLFIHTQDVLAPLKHSYQPEPHRIESVLNHLPALDRSTLGMKLIGTPRYATGFSLQATDSNWRYGQGSLIQGPTLALCQALTGRLVSLPQLSGPGKSLLAQRLKTLDTSA